MLINKKLLLSLFIACLIYAFIKKIFLDSIPEFFELGSELGSIIYDFALAYAGGYIFYWIATFEITHEQKKRNIAVNSRSMLLLMKSIEDLLVFSLHIIHKDLKISFTNEINEDLINVDKDLIQVSIEEEIENNIFIVGKEELGVKYFSELKKLCKNVRDRNESILNNVSILPLNLIDILISIRKFGLHDFVLKYIGLNDYMINKRGVSFNLLPKNSIEFNNSLIELISIYRSLIKIYQKDLGQKYENSDIQNISFRLGIAFDKFTKWV